VKQAIPAQAYTVMDICLPARTTWNGTYTSETGPAASLAGWWSPQCHPPPLRATLRWAAALRQRRCRSSAGLLTQSMSISGAAHPYAAHRTPEQSVEAEHLRAQRRTASMSRTVAGLRAQHVAGRPRRRVLLRVLRQLGVEGIGVHRRRQLHAIGYALPVELLILLIVTDVRVLVGGEAPRIARTRRRARLRSEGA